MSTNIQNIQILLAQINDPATKSVALVKLLKHHNYEVVEAACLKLIKHNDWSVRKFVAQNPSSPIYILEELLHDDDSIVRETAEKTLNDLNGGIAETAEVQQAIKDSKSTAVQQSSTVPEARTLTEAVELFVDGFRPHLELLKGVLQHTDEEIITLFGRDAGWLACSFFFGTDILGEREPDSTALREFRRAMQPYVQNLDKLSDPDLISFFKQNGMTRHREKPSVMLEGLLTLDKEVAKIDTEDLLPRMSNIYVINMMRVAALALEVNSDYMLAENKVKDYAQVCMLAITKHLGTDFGDETPTTIEDRMAAIRSETPVAKLKMFATRKDWQIRSAVANNPSLPLESLHALAVDKDQFVRAGAAKNPKLPLVLQLQLAYDAEFLVRKALLDNEKLSLSVENLLSKDKEREVRDYLIAKKSTSPQKLRNLVRSEDYAIRMALASNPVTPDDILKILARDDEYLVKTTLLERSNLPIEIILLLSNDHEYGVSSQATSLLEKQNTASNKETSTSTTKGYIYILINPSMQGVVKIGRTTRTTKDRISELSSHSGVPTPFELVYERQFNDCQVAEKEIHTRLTQYRLSRDREFFKMPTSDAVVALISLENY